MMYTVLFLASVFLSAISQVVLKTSANVPHENGIREYLNVKVIFAYGLFFISSLLTALAYRGVPLSMGPVLEATGYIWVALLSWFCLKETISRRKLAGLAVIVAGVLLSTV